MTLRNKILLLPYVVILMFDIAVIIVFGNSLLEGSYNGSIKLYYLLSIFVVALVVCGLRVLVVGKTTILDRYLKRTKNDWVFILFISFIVAILIATWAIKYFSISPFYISFVQDLYNSPLKWFDLLNNNYHKLAFYGLIFVIINSIILFLFYKTKNYLEKKNLKIKDENLKSILLVIMGLGIFLFLILFISDPMIYFWDKFLNIKIIKQILSFIFSGSLIYFNVYFLIKR